MPLTRMKVIAITLLAVLVALGSASLFAQNGSSQTAALTLQLTPTSGCPGSIIQYAITSGAPSAPDGVTRTRTELTSYPDGLIFKFDGSSFTVADSVCAGDYVVTAKIMPVLGDNGQTKILEVSTHFTVGGQGCPNLVPCRPVGGVVMPTNTLAIAAPYLALAGLIAAVSAVVAVKKRRD